MPQSDYAEPAHGGHPPDLAALLRRPAEVEHAMGERLQIPLPPTGGGVSHPTLPGFDNAERPTLILRYGPPVRVIPGLGRETPP